MSNQKFIEYEDLPLEEIPDEYFQLDELFRETDPDNFSDGDLSDLGESDEDLNERKNLEQFVQIPPEMIAPDELVEITEEQDELIQSIINQSNSDQRTLAQNVADDFTQIAGEAMRYELETDQKLKKRLLEIDEYSSLPTKPKRKKLNDVPSTTRFGRRTRAPERFGDVVPSKIIYNHE